jgi:hypothetical protein
MQYKAPGRCPVCGEEMVISKLTCHHCQTTIEGEFQACKFCRLPDEQLEFIEVFIKRRGNIRDVEKELGISYPTVRNRLDSVIQSLGYPVEKSDPAAGDVKRQEVLDALTKGEIDASEAARLLRKTVR